MVSISWVNFSFCSCLFSPWFYLVVYMCSYASHWAFRKWLFWILSRQFIHVSVSLGLVTRNLCFFWCCHVWFFAICVVLQWFCTFEGENPFSSSYRLVLADKDLLLHSWVHNIIFWVTAEWCWELAYITTADMQWAPWVVVLLLGAHACVDSIWSPGGQDYI